MEAYWHLSAKRFVDTSCMLTDKELLGKLPVAIQDVMYKYIKDDHLLQVICVFFFFLRSSCYFLFLRVEFLRRKSRISSKEARAGESQGRPGPSRCQTCRYPRRHFCCCELCLFYCSQCSCSSSSFGKPAQEEWRWRIISILK